MSAPPLPPATSSLWHDRHLIPQPESGDDSIRILVADSWRVHDGSVRGLELHRTRFARSVGTDVARSLDLDGFWNAVIEALPRTGEWFPRVELRECSRGLHLLLRVRPAPERQRSLVLASHHDADPRSEPSTKGPDLAVLLQLRDQVRHVDADEAVILTPAGHIIDGSTTSICWWRGDTLCVPSASLPRVDGVTVRTVRTIATALGIPVAEELTRPDELDGHEVWALNALHGVRIVTQWRDGPLGLAEDPGRLASWERRLELLRRPLPPLGAYSPAREEQVS